MASSRVLRWVGLLGVALALPVLVPPAAPAVAADQCRPPATARLTQRSWAQNRLDVERVWPLTTGLGQRVAVVDTGVDGKHPQLRGHVTTGYDVLTNTYDGDSDCHGHGTFVAGIIAAQPASGIGFTGVAPGATVVPIRETNTDTVAVDDLANAISAAVQFPGVDIINVSTTTTGDDPRLRAAVNRALAANIVVVAAAGNDAQNGDAAKYPAVYPGVLAAGAIDSAGNRAGYSETVGIGVVAPGQDLISTGAGGTGLVASAQGGTSFAAPYVAGVAALVRAYHPNLSAAQVVHRIEATADHPAGALPDRQFGWGVVDPYAAVTAVLPEEGQQPLAAPSRSPVPLAAPAGPAEPDRSGTAYALAGAALGVVLLGGATAVLIPLGRRRGWRSALRDAR
ncbi:type VII secretion-associated serine protease mycosin [Rugosimonospora africana]|uniref:Peptidase S8 n=1 Tax=Rugosimonospora africana TaxID=556532 RepID=A0A8J3QWS6_9ACTN|nr:type VII secretion-associated serine protease mycosin [Rugosimonospora africana]GIH18840.1 peptidase S8 [Rugosimonospora africana]